MGDELRGTAERCALRNVLVAWSVRNPMAGYAQGLNAVAACLLGPATCVLPPVTAVNRATGEVEGGADLWAFQIMCWLLESGGAGEYYDHHLTGLHVDLAVVGELVAQAYPTPAKAMAAATVDNAWFLTNFLLSGFVNSVPMRHCRRIWDIMMLAGHAQGLIGTVLAFHQCLQGVGEAASTGDIMQVIVAALHDWQTAPVGDGGAATAGSPGSTAAVSAHERLVVTVQAAAQLTPALVRRLRAKHRPAVIGRLAGQEADRRRPLPGRDPKPSASDDAIVVPRQPVASDAGRASWLSRSLWLRNTAQWTASTLQSLDLSRARPASTARRAAVAEAHVLAEALTREVDEAMGRGRVPPDTAGSLSGTMDSIAASEGVSAGHGGGRTSRASDSGSDDEDGGMPAVVFDATHPMFAGGAPAAPVEPSPPTPASTAATPPRPFTPASSAASITPAVPPRGMGHVGTKESEFPDTASPFTVPPPQSLVASFNASQGNASAPIAVKPRTPSPPPGAPKADTGDSAGPHSNDTDGVLRRLIVVVGHALRREEHFHPPCPVHWAAYGGTTPDALSATCTCHKRVVTLRRLQELLVQCRDHVPFIAYTRWVIQAYTHNRRASPSATQGAAPAPPGGSETDGGTAAALGSAAVAAFQGLQGLVAGGMARLVGAGDAASACATGEAPAHDAAASADGVPPESRAPPSLVPIAEQKAVSALLLLSRALVEVDSLVLPLKAHGGGAGTSGGTGGPAPARAGFTAAQRTRVRELLGPVCVQVAAYLQLSTGYMWTRLHALMQASIRAWAAQTPSAWLLAAAGERSDAGTADAARAADGTLALWALHGVCVEAALLLAHVPNLRRASVDAMPTGVHTMCVTQQRAVAERAARMRRLAARHDAVAAAAVAEAEAQQKRDLARIVNWALGQVETVKLAMKPYHARPSEMPMQVAHALQWRLSSLYSYVAVVDSVQWRVRLVVLVQETNAQLHHLVEQRHGQQS